MYLRILSKYDENSNLRQTKSKNNQFHLFALSFFLNHRSIVILCKRIFLLNFVLVFQLKFKRLKPLLCCSIVSVLVSRIYVQNARSVIEKGRNKKVFLIPRARPISVGFFLRLSICAYSCMMKINNLALKNSKELN